MKYQKIREEELKNKFGKDWFNKFDTTEIIENPELLQSLNFNPNF